MATTYTDVVKLPLQGLDDPANIEQVNEGFRLTDAAIQKAWQGRAAYNLLSNADFTQPYNQRGLTAYSGNDYTIDRWRIGNSYSKVTVYSKSVQINAEGGNCIFRQLIDPPAYLGGKTLTAVLWTGSGVTVCSGNMPAEVPTTNAVFASTTVKDGVTLALQRETSGYLVYRISVTDGNSISILRAAVYVGGYTAANVPDFVPQKPAEVAADCREYFRRSRAESTYATIGVGIARSATTAWINVPREGRMRIGKPTIKTSGSLMLYGGGITGSVPATAVTLDKISDKYIRLTVTASGLTAGAAVVATAGETGDFVLDEIADL